jgi:uncharacterized protein (TIGR02117 family)
MLHLVCLSLVACGGTPVRETPPAASAAANVPAAAAATAPAAAATAQRMPVYVIRRGWHVDVGIAVTDMQPQLEPVAAAFPDSKYLLFGFGERSYLLHGGVGYMVAALFPGAALVMVTSVHAEHPENVFGEANVARFALTPQQMSDLQTYIRHTFAESDGVVVPVAPASGPATGASYYESAQRYSALHTCNTWAAEALQSARLSLDSSGVEFSSQLWHQVQHLESQRAATSSP